MPADWKVRAVRGGRDERLVWLLTFTGPSAAKATTVTLAASSFNKAADQLGFTQTSKGWSITGPSFAAPAIERQGVTWHGLYGEVSVTTEDARGKATSREVRRAFASSLVSDYSLIIEMDPARSREKLYFLLESVQFSRPGKP